MTKLHELVISNNQVQAESSLIAAIQQNQNLTVLDISGNPCCETQECHALSFLISKRPNGFIFCHNTAGDLPAYLKGKRPANANDQLPQLALNYGKAAEKLIKVDEGMKFGGGTKAAESLESLNDPFFITAQGRDEDEESLRLVKRATDARRLDVFHRNARTLLLT